MAINKVPILDDGDRLYDDVMPERLSQAALDAALIAQINDPATAVGAAFEAAVAVEARRQAIIFS